MEDSRESFNVEDPDHYIVIQDDAMPYEGKSSVNAATLNSINTLIGGGMLGKHNFKKYTS